MRELSLNVMDIVQNAISAEATLIEITVDEDLGKGTLTITVSDNGKGMTAERLAKVRDPFYTTRTTRNVGLGIPLFKMEAEMTGGSFSIQSEPGKGTALEAVFKTGSIDMIPLGDINATVELLVTCNTSIDFCYTRSRLDTAAPDTDRREMRFDTREIREVLGDEVQLNDPEVVLWIKAYLAEQTQELGGSNV